MYDNIPIELQQDVINRLPVKSLLACRKVSTAWKAYIDSPEFILNYGFRVTDECSFILMYEQGFQTFMRKVNDDFQLSPVCTNLQLSCLKPIGSSEGIRSFAYGSNMMIVIWNPSIKKLIGVFVPYFVSQLDCEKLLFGFGVRPDAKDPTFIKILYPFCGQGNWFVNVFTLSTNTWYTIKNHYLPRPTIRIKKRPGQAVLGKYIYWVGGEVNSGDNGITVNNYVLISFDLQTRCFHVLDLPQVLREVLPITFFISQKDSSLILSGTFYVDDIVLLCAWELTVNGFTVLKANMLFSITSNHPVWVLGFTKSDLPIFEKDEQGRGMSHTLHVFDPVAADFTPIGMEADGGSFFMAPYKESLILLNKPDRSICTIHL